MPKNVFSPSISITHPFPKKCTREDEEDPSKNASYSSSIIKVCQFSFQKAIETFR
jgi:hypothetical protein